MSIFKKRNSVPPSVWTNPIHFIACGFGVGAMPWMPGTWGTLVGVIFYVFLHSLSLLSYCVVVVILFMVGVVICGITNRDFGTHDHSAAVWDEIVGFLFVMIAVPYRWYFIVIGFILFRVFDIWKPWPIKWVERKAKGGFGVMMDDVVAALYGWVILQLLVLIFL